MSDYCTCCTTNARYIECHYDPGGTITADSDAAAELALYQGYAARNTGEDQAPLTLADFRSLIKDKRTCALHGITKRLGKAAANDTDNVDGAVAYYDEGEIHPWRISDGDQGECFATFAEALGAAEAWDAAYQDMGSN